MANARLIRRIMNTPEDLIALVSNVEAYPEFINLITALRVTNRTQPADRQERFEAEATIAYKFIRESFSSIVFVDHAKNYIKVSKADRSGAVKALNNEWYFHELSDGSTLVDFSIDVKLKAFPLEMVLRDKFDRAGQHLMNLFEVKASQVCKTVGDKNLDVQQECRRLNIDQPTA